MRRLLFLLLMCLVLSVVLTAVLNAPRVAEARAHEAAAHAIQAQAVVTGIAVTGLLLLLLFMALALGLVVGLLLWSMVTGRLAMTPLLWGRRFGTQSLKQKQMRIHHAPYPQLPANTYQLPVAHYEADQEYPLDWSVWETTPWDIEEPF